MIAEADLPIFEGQTFVVTPRINGGGKGGIYVVSPTHVAKVKDGRFASHSSREKEYAVHEKLYRARMPVAKPEGLFRVRIMTPLERGIGHGMKRDFNSSLRDYVPALVMERLPGMNLHDYIKRNKLPDRKITFLTRKCYDEIAKAKFLGFRPRDEGVINTQYDPKTNKLWLVDFDGWMESPRRRIKCTNKEH